MKHTFISLAVAFGLTGCSTTSPLKVDLPTNSQVVAGQKKIKFNVPVESIYFPASKDIDGDGIDDVVISAQIDVYSQLGIECCEVPAKLIDRIAGAIPQVYLSNFGNPKFIQFPSEAATHRTWAGAFFELNGIQYYLHGKNGELGLPSENKGEKSQIWRITKKPDGVNFDLAAEFTENKTTASVAVRSVPRGIEILQNNYNSFGSRTSVYQSETYLFSPNENLAKIKPSVILRGNIAHNEVKYSSVFDDYILAAAEVWKTNDGNATLSTNPSSYYGSLVNQVDLVPVLYDLNHAGFSAEEIPGKNNIYVLEFSSEFFGHQNGGFKGAGLKIYEINRETLKLVECAKNCGEIKIDLPKANQVYLNRIDIDFNGSEEVYLTGYTQKGVPLFHLSENIIKQLNMHQWELQEVVGSYGHVRMLRDVNERCLFSISSKSRFKRGLDLIPITISECRRVKVEYEEKNF